MNLVPEVSSVEDRPKLSLEEEHGRSRAVLSVKGSHSEVVLWATHTLHIHRHWLIVIKLHLGSVMVHICT